MILIVDDDKSFQMSLKMCLEKNNFSVVALDNATQSLNFLNQQLPDIIIIDILMPQVNGYELLMYIRETLKLYYIPIIILTAKSLTQDRVRAYSLGCNAYLSKPFNVDELLSIINNLITHSQNYLKRMPLSLVLNKPLLSLGNTTISNRLELRPKEQQILNLVVNGYMNKEIAKQLHISNRHVERYIGKLFNLFQVNSRTELVKIAIKNLLVT